jgi:type IV pilus assembly protein PilA
MKRGFTLIELLAVIVILAIIALIATPIVLNIINDSKESATLRSAEMYITGVEQSVMKKNMNAGGNFSPSSCQVQQNGNLLCDDKDTLEVEVKGEKPTSGTITFEEGKIITHKLRYDENTIVINGELNPKACKITLDKDNDGVAETGDMITCSTESFHVISNDGEQISMLAQFNLDVGRIFDSETEEFEEIENSSRIQNNEAKGRVDNSDIWYGVLPFSTVDYWWNNDNSTFIVDTNYESEGREYPFVYGDYKNVDGQEQNVIYPYVKAYEEYLKSENVSSAEATLISYEQLTQLGCNPENNSCSEENSWVYTTSYWSGTAYNNEYVWQIDSGGYFYNSISYYGDNFRIGVRPVVNISVSEL